MTAKGTTSAITTLLPLLLLLLLLLIYLSPSLPPPPPSPPGSLYHRVPSSLPSLLCSVISLIFVSRCHLAVTLSPAYQVFFSFCLLSFFNFPAIPSIISIFIVLLWDSVFALSVSFLSSCHATFPHVGLFALSVAELARLSQFLHLILQEMTMLQSDAIISHIKGLKLNLVELKRNNPGFYRVVHLCISLIARCQKGCETLHSVYVWVCVGVCV